MKIFSPEINRTSLLQGDLLVRNEHLCASLRDGHSYYAKASDYTHFLVLTQSCDLVRRGKKPCKARYITLAAARPLQTVVDRFLESRVLDSDKLSFRLFEKSDENVARQFIERIVHHTEEGYFFIPKSGSHTIARDLCVFLPLSIAIRSQDHYEACLSAKVAQLTDVFQAKVGWLTGNQYSRVGTPDLGELVEDEDAYLKGLWQQSLRQESVWLRRFDYDRLKPALHKLRTERPNDVVTEEQLTQLVSQLPSEATEIASRVVAVLVEKNLLPRDKEIKARNILSNDGALKKYLRDMVRTS